MPRPAAITSSQGKGWRAWRTSAGAAAPVVPVARAAAERRCQQPRDDLDDSRPLRLGAACRATCLVGDLVAGAAQARADDADAVARAEPARSRSARQRQHVGVAERVFELGERAERQAQPIAPRRRARPRSRRDAGWPCGSPHAAVNVSWPADSSAISKRDLVVVPAGQLERGDLERALRPCRSRGSRSGRP